MHSSPNTIFSVFYFILFINNYNYLKCEITGPNNEWGQLCVLVEVILSAV